MDGVQTLFAPRRFVLDEIPLRAAVQAGVDVRTEFGVKELIFENGRVCGIRGRANGQTHLHSETARLVIGADGVNSTIARLAGARMYREEPEASAVWFSYWSGVPLSTVHIWFRPARLFAAYQTNNGLTLALVYVPVAEAAALKADIEGNFYQEVRTHVSELAAMLGAGKRVERLIGTEHQPNFYRQAHGPGWALVGDAAPHHDSINPSGITNAFTCAEFLAEAADRGLSGKDDMDVALASWQARRDERWLGHFEFITQFAKLEPPAPELVALVGELAKKPAEAAAFGAFFQGHEEYLNFFAPENIRRIFAQ